MNLLGTKTLETERLILRKFKMEDVNQVFKNYGSDPNVNKYLSWKTHKTINDTQESIKIFISAYENNDFIGLL